MAILDALLAAANASFFYWILIWLLVDSLKLSKRNQVVHLKHRPTLFAATTVLFCAVMSVLSMTFAFYAYCTHGVIGYALVSLATTWLLATIASLYSMKTTLRFPLALILWWVYATVIHVISISLGVVKNIESLNFWFFLSKDNVVHMVSLPMLLFMCCNALLKVCASKLAELKEGLLHKELESSTDDDGEAFTKASIWSKLTFRWLNPIFKMGQIQKLELAHLPFVPHSETAASASSMLEQSLVEGGSLTKAIIHSIWKSLALNAVFAGQFLHYIYGIHFLNGWTRDLFWEVMFPTDFAGSDAVPQTCLL